MANARTEFFRGPLMRTSFAWNMLSGREQEKDDGTKKTEYGVTLIMPSDGDWAPIYAAIEQVLKEKNWIEKFKNDMVRNPILDGGSKAGRSTKTGEFHPGMGPGVKFIRAKSNDPIKVFNKNLVPITDAKDCQSGYWGYPVLNVFSWEHPKNGPGLSIGISMFQYIREDELLGGEGAPTDPTKFFEKVDTGGSAAPKDASALFG